MVLALVFIPVAAIMVGVAGLTYRESLFRNETEMLRYIGRISELREAQLARSVLLAKTLDRLATDGVDEAARCQDQLNRLNAGDVWQSATLRRTADDEFSTCAYVSASAEASENTTRVVHTLGDGRRVEAVLAPLRLEPPVGLERGLVGDFVDDWRPVAADPGWKLDSWPFGTGDGPQIFSGSPAGSRAHTYALGALDRYGISSVFAIPSRDLYAPARERLFTTLGLLLTILALGIVSAWASIEWVVLRRLRGVQTVAGSLASGDLSARIRPDWGEPSELRELGTSINDMAERIERRTQEVEGAVREQRRLLRELHHRVKNNFQVIGSLLSLQRRSLPPEVGDVLRYSEDHVAAMSTAYRISYASGDIADVGLSDLTEQILSHVLRSSGLPNSSLTGDVVVEGASVDLDSAVALGLLLTELLVPVCREAARLETTVRLDMLAGVSGLNILISGPALDPEAGRSGLPKRFLEAFLNQVDAEMEAHEEQPFFRARVRVPVERLTFAASGR